MKGFVISWFYPPINTSEAAVTYKLLKNSSYYYDVFTQVSDDRWSYKSAKTSLTCRNVKVITPDVDGVQAWIEAGVAHFREHSTDYDFIMSRAMPPESCELALRIKQEFPAVKWIASFGDPIASDHVTDLQPDATDKLLNSMSATSKAGANLPRRIALNLLSKLISTRHDYRKRKHANKLKQLSESTLELADLIVLNNPYQRDYMLQQSHVDFASKVQILPHSFDKGLYTSGLNSTGGSKKSAKLCFAHLGHLNAVRSPKLLSEAIKRLKSEDTSLSDKVEFSFYGNMADDDKLFIIENDLVDVVQLKQPVDYLTSLQIMQGSDWLLLLDADLSFVTTTNIYFAAKLADYIGAARPILGVTMSQGASADILSEIGAVAVQPDVELIYHSLKSIIYDNYSGKATEWSRFDAVNVAQGFDTAVSVLLNESN